MNSCNTDRFLATTVVYGLSSLNCTYKLMESVVCTSNRKKNIYLINNYPHQKPTPSQSNPAVVLHCGKMYLDLKEATTRGTFSMHVLSFRFCRAAPFATSKE